MKLSINDKLPQSEAEWLSTDLFKVDSMDIGSNRVRYAVTDSSDSSDLLTVMVGGIPRNCDRQLNLPLINKLYGRIAMLALANNTTSLMYTHPGTGGSKGDLFKDTTRDRITTLTEIVRDVSSKKNIKKISLIGMSAGSYIVARSVAGIRENDLDVESIVLQSPAAFPKEIEDLPYGEKFSKIVRSRWDINKSPVFTDLDNIAAQNTGILISYFQKDDPPIPIHVQNAYYDKAHELMSKGNNITTCTIYNVEHNFRRIGYELGQNIVSNDSIRAVGNNITNYIHAQHN